ncbi:hypothetical protein M2135_001233 [Parabacteroides sp. PF5-9]|nr:hypothetical protein [Parabacteroides sp. PF5-9]
MGINYQLIVFTYQQRGFIQNIHTFGIKSGKHGYQTIKLLYQSS